MKCRVGDLAVVVGAEYKSNLGKIVRVVEPHDGRGEIHFRNQGPIWWVESHSMLFWTKGRKRFRRRTGPVPDYILYPIRGNEQSLTEAGDCLRFSGGSARSAPVLVGSVRSFGSRYPRWEYPGRDAETATLLCHRLHLAP